MNGRGSRRADARDDVYRKVARMPARRLIVGGDASSASLTVALGKVRQWRLEETQAAPLKVRFARSARYRRTVDSSPWPNRLRELREAMSSSTGRQVRLEDVAGAVGVSMDYMSKLERGVRRPKTDLAHKLSEFFSVEASYLATGSSPIEIDEDKIVGAYVRLLRRQHGLALEVLAIKVSEAGIAVRRPTLQAIEHGTRSFDPSDCISQQLASVLGISDAKEFRALAMAAHRAGQLSELLRDLHPHGVISTDAVAYVLPDRRPIDLPPYVRALMLPGDVAYLQPDRDRPAETYPWAYYIVTRPGLRFFRGVALVDGVIVEIDDEAPLPAKRKLTKFPPNGEAIVAVVPERDGDY